MRCVQCYADCIVLRHPTTGAAATASKYLNKPCMAFSFISRRSLECWWWCWWASFSSPSGYVYKTEYQTIPSSVTINKEIGHLEGITVTMVGDLLYGRTVHSLARLLTFFNVCFWCLDDSLCRSSWTTLLLTSFRCPMRSTMKSLRRESSRPSLRSSRTKSWLKLIFSMLLEFSRYVFVWKERNE